MKITKKDIIIEQQSEILAEYENLLADLLDVFQFNKIQSICLNLILILVYLFQYLFIKKNQYNIADCLLTNYDFTGIKNDKNDENQ